MAVNNALYMVLVMVFGAVSLSFLKRVFPICTSRHHASTQIQASQNVKVPAFCLPHDALLHTRAGSFNFSNIREGLSDYSVFHIQFLSLSMLQVGAAAMDLMRARTSVKRAPEMATSAIWKTVLRE